MNLRIVMRFMFVLVASIWFVVPARVCNAQRTHVKSFKYPNINTDSEAALFHSDGNIYVGMESPVQPPTQPAMIDVYDKRGNFLRSLDLSGISGGLKDIHAMCERPNGNILIGELFGNRIWEITTSGSIVRFIPFNACQSLTSLPDGGVLAVDHSDQWAQRGRVVILNSDGSDLPPKKRTTELSMIPEVEPRKDSANETRSSFL